MKSIHKYNLFPEVCKTFGYKQIFYILGQTGPAKNVSAMCVLVIDTYFAIFVGVLFSLIILPLVLYIIFCLLCILLNSFYFAYSWEGGPH